MRAPPRTTMLLRRMASGDAEAADELLPLVYDELRGLAGHYMAGERRHHTLQPTALVHEAWMKLAGSDVPSFRDRSHFVAIAARAMRRVLIEFARRRKRDKRGGGQAAQPLEEALDQIEAEGPDLLELDEALGRLDAIDGQLARIVEMRFFGGASNDEIAEELGVSTRTVERGWRTAQAWLATELEEPGG